MADVTIISGSTLGSAEYVAEHVAGILEQQGLSTDILHGAELAELSTEGGHLDPRRRRTAGESPAAAGRVKGANAFAIRGYLRR